MTLQTYIINPSQKNLFEMGYFVENDILSLKDSQNADYYKYNYLLDYPVVYVHTWQDDSNTWNCYIGETIDLVRRTKEHGDESAKNNFNWWDNWDQGKNKKSFYFGGSFMNKSLTLDIEDCLIALVKQFQTSPCITCVNGRVNSQGNYSNKSIRNALVEEIWETLTTQGFSGILAAYPLRKMSPIPQLSSFSVTTRSASTNLEYIEGHLSDILAKTDTCKETDVKHAITQFINKSGHPLFLTYPVVYIHIWNSNDNIHIYVGEANDFIERTWEHVSFKDNGKNNWHKDWQKTYNECKNGSNKKDYFIAFTCESFNKSLTLDLENQLIQYFIIHQCSANSRTNEQRMYDNKDLLYPIFCRIVDTLVKKNTFFKSLTAISKEAAFMSSPFLSLTNAQGTLKKQILREVYTAINSTKKSLIVVSSGAGTGKTVLASSLFFNLKKQFEETGKEIYFIINNHELLNSYSYQTKAWQLTQGPYSKNTVMSATVFLNKKRKISPNSVVIIDEGHLLKEGVDNGHTYHQLAEILAKTKVVVLMFDNKQYVFRNCNIASGWNAWNNQKKVFNDYLAANALSADVTVLSLSQQLRMHCSSNTFDYIVQTFCTENELSAPPYPVKVEPKQDIEGDIYYFEDNNKYILGICTTPELLFKKISKYSDDEKPAKVLASYCWAYDDKKNILGKYAWHQTAKDSGIWTLSGNSEEVGAIHDIQGFDLNHAGVILGKSLVAKQENGKWVVKVNKKERRGVSKDTNDSIAKRIILNEINVLLTRGIKSLWIYVEDNNLRKQLVELFKSKI